MYYILSKSAQKKNPVSSYSTQIISLNSKESKTASLWSAFFELVILLQGAPTELKTPGLILRQVCLRSMYCQNAASYNVYIYN